MNISHSKTYLQASAGTTSEIILEPTTPLSTELVAKSVQAAVAAIEVYNKPNFSYREEAFALLMSNAWEILLKAKWVFDHAEAIESLYELTAAPRWHQGSEDKSEWKSAFLQRYLFAWQAS